MSYDYVKNAYRVNPIVGRRVRHNEIDKWGTIARENRSQSHHVMVRLDGQKHAVPCHPTALDYIDDPQREISRRVEAALSGQEICHRCGATWESYADACMADLADLADPCPGFQSIEAVRNPIVRKVYGFAEPQGPKQAEVK